MARLLVRSPPATREAIWRAWRALDRSRRRRLERRGDFSRSSPALHDMDRGLAEHLNFRGGFFVEAGANDGYHQSNTYRLERALGWRGVLIEPVPSLYRAAVRERPGARVFNCALVSRTYAQDDVRLIYGGMMTTVAGTRETEAADRSWAQAAHAMVQEAPEHDFVVRARTLSSILDEVSAPEIDFLSLDVEGFETQVLEGLDLTRHAPRWILVEVRERADRREAVEAILGDRYEVARQLSPYDVLYRRRG
ncbi:MAG: FkbM family methyltransferase [Solirubrobacteraceae bacterium]